MLSAWLFQGDSGAQRAIYRLAGHALRNEDIEDAGAVSWPPDSSRPTAWQVRDLGNDHRLSGAFWGLLFASLFLLPLSLRSTADTDLRPATWPSEGLVQLGFDAEFAVRVRTTVVSGTSALFILHGSLTTTDAIATLMPRAAEEVIRLRLTVSQYDRLHAGFDANDA